MDSLRRTERAFSSEGQCRHQEHLEESAAAVVFVEGGTVVREDGVLLSSSHASLRVSVARFVTASALPTLVLQTLQSPGWRFRISVSLTLCRRVGVVLASLLDRFERVTGVGVGRRVARLPYVKLFCVGTIFVLCGRFRC